jgi:hypothetical protein
MKILNLHGDSERAHENEAARALSWLQYEIPGLEVFAPQLMCGVFVSTQTFVSNLLWNAHWDLIVCTGLGAFFALDTMDGNSAPSGERLFLVHPELFPHKNLKDKLGSVWQLELTKKISKRLVLDLKNRQIEAIISDDGQLGLPFLEGKFIHPADTAKGLKGPLRKAIRSIQKENAYRPTSLSTAIIARKELERIFEAASVINEIRGECKVPLRVDLHCQGDSFLAICETGKKNATAFIRGKLEQGVPDERALFPFHAIEDFLEKSGPTPQHRIQIPFWKRDWRAELCAGPVCEGSLFFGRDPGFSDAEERIPQHFARTLVVDGQNFWKAMSAAWSHPHLRAFASVVLSLEETSMATSIEYPPEYEGARKGEGLKVGAVCTGDLPFRFALDWETKGILCACAHAFPNNAKLEICMNGESDPFLVRIKGDSDLFWVV